MAVAVDKPTPQPDTVDALLAATVRIVEDERNRGSTADSKAGQLVGFTGVILAIDASLGRDVFDHGISGFYSDLFVGFFVLSLLALVAAAYVAIRGVLRPQSTLAFRDVPSLAEDDLVLADSIEIKRTLIRTYGRELSEEERRNNRKLEVIDAAALWLMLGVLALACAGATLAARHIDKGMSKQSPQSQPSNGGSSGDGQGRPKPPPSLPLATIKKGGGKPSTENP